MSDALMLTTPTGDLSAVRARLAAPAARPVSPLTPLGAAALAAATSMATLWIVVTGPGDLGRSLPGATVSVKLGSAAPVSSPGAEASGLGSL